MSAAMMNSQLPWSSSEQENKRFTRISVVVLALTLLLAIIVQLTEVLPVPREEEEKLPPQLARIIEPIELPPPPEVKPEPEPVVEETPPPPVEQPVPEKKPEPKPEPVKKVEPKPEPKPEPTQEEKVAEARENAKKSGLLAFQDDLLSMRESANLDNLADTQMIEGAGQAEKTERKRIAADQVTQTSGGVQSAEVSQNIGARGELAGRRTTEFSAPEEGAASLAAKRIEEESEVIGNRDLASIRKMLDANKGAVYSLYRRALREDPALQGKVTMKLTIEPDGSISDISIVNSELNNPDLENKLLARVAMINFGAQNVSQTQLEYAFNFLPY